MSTTQGNSGFTLTQPESESAPPASTPYTSTAPAEATLPMSTDTSARDFTLGTVLLLVLAVVLLFVRKTWANHLVAKRVQPKKANRAGWSLYVCLLIFIGGGGLLAFNEPFQTAITIGFVLLLFILSLGLTIATSRN